MGHPTVVLRRAAVHLFFCVSLVAGLVGLALLPDTPEAPGPAGDETALLDRCIQTMSNQAAPISDGCDDGGGTCCTTGDDDDDGGGDDPGGTTTTTSPTGDDDDGTDGGDDPGGTTTTTSPTGDDDDDDGTDGKNDGDDDDGSSGGDGDEHGVPGSGDTDETDPFVGDDDDDDADGDRSSGNAPGTSDASDDGERSRGGYDEHDEHVGSDIGHQGLVRRSAGTVSFALPFGTLKLPVDDLRTGLLVWTILHGLSALWIGQRRLRWLLLPAGRRRDRRDGDTPLPA